MRGPRRVVVTSIVRMARPDQVSANYACSISRADRVAFVTPVPESVWRADDPYALWLAQPDGD